MYLPLHLHLHPSLLSCPSLSLFFSYPFLLFSLLSSSILFHIFFSSRCFCVACSVFCCVVAVLLCVAVCCGVLCCVVFCSVVFCCVLFCCVLLCSVKCVVYVWRVGCAVWCVVCNAQKPVCRFKTRPCERSKRLRVNREHVRMFKRMRTCCRFTRRRFQFSHGVGVRQKKRV